MNIDYFNYHVSIYASYNTEILIDKIINLIPDNVFLHYKKYEIKVGIESDYLGKINDADPLKESQFLTKRDHTPPLINTTNLDRQNKSGRQENTGEKEETDHHTTEYTYKSFRRRYD